MALVQLSDSGALSEFLNKHKNVLLTVSAHWCGPCKASKPQLEQLAEKYSADMSKDIQFGIVYESDIGEDIHQYSVRAFPTYVLFQNGKETNRVEGVNFAGIEDMINAAAASMVMTGGHTLSDGAAALTPEQARAARLAKLGAPAPAPPAAEKPAAAVEEPPAKKEEDVEMKDAAGNDEAAKDGDGDAKMEDAEPEMVDPTLDLEPSIVKTLTDDMGFPLIRAQKGLLNGNARTVDAAIEWLTEHQDDANIDDPIPLAPKDGVVAQSYKCNECGKILSNMANLELHANKTGHSDFEESTTLVKPLTPEEKEKKIAEIKELLKLKRAEREEIEKVDDVEREKSRRTMGKEMAKTREQMDREQRKRDALQRKREKEAARRERERIRAELEKDKLERKANKGKLSSRLGVDGYNPDGIQYDKEADEQEGDAAAPQKKKSAGPSAAKIDEYIKKVSSYRAGGDGLKCLKILKIYISNVVDNPTEEKFKSINMENKAYKAKVKPFIGAKSLLLAVGFSQNEGGTALVLKEEAEPPVLADAKAKLEAAISSY
ncbi:Thioredoxin H2 [Seminavis robusta]|uniref:Thioredoxin H2 n=1 Tax=Seminavis robusta TaxID=568900 RepID=A0A9N8E1Y0_9STRA|nr:Thioredoxin H2 [Seminavis robusta]|eukprot:Sro565_g167590.1 Thioredoxin H2 (546) ;mRNA; f:22336-24150